MKTAGLKDKIPPHNEEAELATLGALLLDPEALSTVLRYLRANDFYRTSHRKIYEAILDLFGRSDPIDLITVVEKLREKEDLQSCGGTSYVSNLSSSVPTSANVEYYARIVQTCSIRRDLARIASEIVSQSYEDSVDVRYLIEAAERHIFDIADRQHTGHYLEAKEIITKTVEAIEKLYHTKDSYTGIPTGFTELDNLTSGFQNSEFIVIGARPSVGKTALALGMAANMSIKNKIPVGFFTLEMSSMALMQRLISSEARIESTKLRTGLLKPSDFHKLTEAAGKIYEAPLYIDDTPNQRLLDLRSQARRMKMQHSVTIIFVDYLTLISSERMDIPRHEQIAEVSRSLKSLARELDIPVVALSQVRRETEGKRPTLADLRESGSIEQDADVVIFLHRKRSNEVSDDEPEASIETELNVAKQRNGPVGTVKIAFIAPYTKFEALSPIDENR